MNKKPRRNFIAGGISEAYTAIKIALECPTTSSLLFMDQLNTGQTTKCRNRLSTFTRRRRCITFGAASAPNVTGVNCLRVFYLRPTATNPRRAWPAPSQLCDNGDRRMTGL